MIVRWIRLQDDEHEKGVAWLLDEELAIVRTPYADELEKALRCVMFGEIPKAFRKIVTAGVLCGELSFSVRFQDGELTAHDTASGEDATATYQGFVGAARDRAVNGDIAALLRHPRRLMCLRPPSPTWQALRSYRLYRDEFIKAFHPIALCEEKELWLTVRHTGEFRVMRPRNRPSGEEGGASGEWWEVIFASVSEYEAVLYHCWSMLVQLRFEEGFDRMRGDKENRPPLLMLGVCSRLDIGLDTAALFAAAEELTCQVIVLDRG